MRKLLLFCMGLLPFPIGFWMNSIMMENMDLAFPYMLVSIVCLLIWFLFGLLLYDDSPSVIKFAIPAHIVAFITLLLVVFQEVIRGAYWFSTVGHATQFYYLPLLRLSYTLAPSMHYLWQSMIVCFLMMYAVFVLGCYAKARLRK